MKDEEEKRKDNSEIESNNDVKEAHKHQYFLSSGEGNFIRKLIFEQV